MTTKKVIATPFDPLVARDGRPFGSGDVAHSHSWLMPSAFSGSLRTAVGKHGKWRKKNGVAPFNFKISNDVEKLKEISTTGALPYLKNLVLKDENRRTLDVLYLPKPFDCVVSESGNVRKPYVVRPEVLGGDEGEGVNWPDGINLRPAMLQGDNDEGFKPVSTVPFWSWARMMEWLGTSQIPVGTTVSDEVFPQLREMEAVLRRNGLNAFPEDVRVGVKIDGATGTAEDGALFTTVGLDLFQKSLKRSIVLYSQVEFPDGVEIGGSFLSSLGGKKRLAGWEVSDVETNSFAPPDELKQKVKETGRVRMVLATPAIFKKGYYPGWLEEKDDYGFLMGNPPSCVDVKLKLVSMAIDRWIPVSGWDLAKKGPKAVRRLVPAGGVYFFEIVANEEERDKKVDELFKNAWFKSVCDDKQDRRDGLDEEQDRRDGFGVALWGVWDYGTSGN